jgi:hypothetical protein
MTTIHLSDSHHPDCWPQDTDNDLDDDDWIDGITWTENPEANQIEGECEEDED